jgi:hypothetical protein
MHPEVQENVSMELAKIKSIKPVDYTFNMIKWYSTIESTCNSIEEKLSGYYHKLQFIMNYLDASLTAEVKSFKAEISTIQNKYLHGNPDKWTASYISGEIIKTYNEMSEDGTWQCKIGEKDQIIAFTTKVAKLQTKLDKQVVAFSTQAKSVNSPSSEINANGGKHSGKMDGPYTVAELRLTKKGDTVTSNGKMYHWCTGDHYSGGTKYNGMNADHKSCDRDAWQVRLDTSCNARTNDKTSDGTPKPDDAPTQKFALNHKL